MAPEVLWVINKAWVLLVGVMWYNKKNQDATDTARDVAIHDLEKRQIASDAKYITESHMKEAIREALEPYKEDQQEIKLLLRGLNDQIFALSKDMAVQNAIRSLSNDQQNNVGG